MMPHHQMARRSFLKTLAAGAGSLALAPWAPAAPGEDAGGAGKPNILYINADDLGVMDVAYAGSKFYQTPNLDRLAAEGMVFTNAYAPAANCAPSRACCMTGLYPPRHGIYTVGSSARGSRKLRKLVPTANTTVLADEHVTIAEALKANGYRSISLGKWHLGADPRTQGFDENVGGTTRGGPPSYFSPYRNPALPDGPKGEHLPARLAAETINIIRANKDRPFFVYLPFFSVHSPHQGRKDLVAKYKGRPPGPGQGHATYAAMIEAMDAAIGKVLAAVKALGLVENTLVLFTSDNGGISRISKQTPFRAGKGSYYEGGIREPMIVRWPKVVPASSRCDVPVHGIDFYPTFLEATGTPRPKGKRLDGVSLMPLLKQTGTLPARPLFWHFPIYLQASSAGNHEGRDPLFRTRPGCVMRLGPWKLHEYFEDGGLELYNLDTDAGERKNLAAAMPEKVKELHAIMKAWRAKTGAPVPTELNGAYDEAADMAARAGRSGGGKGKRRTGRK